MLGSKCFVVNYGMDRGQWYIYVTMYCMRLFSMFTNSCIAKSVLTAKQAFIQTKNHNATTTQICICIPTKH